jgi:hypothetical protein
VSDPTDRHRDDVDPERFIARAEQRWQAAADEARAAFERARSGSPAEVAAAAVDLARILRGPGYLDRAGAVLGEAIVICKAHAGSGDRGALEALGDLLRESDRKPEAIRFYELAAAAGNTDAAQQAVELLLQAEFVTVGGSAVPSSALRQLPRREQQVLALTTSAADHEYVGEVLKLSPTEVRQYEQRGLKLLQPHLAAPTIDVLTIGAQVRTGGFDPEFEDPPNMPGQVIGGTLTDDDRALIQLMDPKDRARYLLQKRIQEKAEMAGLLSQLRHQTAMSIINNIR